MPMLIPYASRMQIAKLDSLMVRRFRIPVAVMMENAGYRMAEFVRQEFPLQKKGQKNAKKNRRILICAGKGNNGGDGIAAARHLLNFGYSPSLFLITAQLRGEPKMRLDSAKALGITAFTSLARLAKEIKRADIIYDCLIGYNMSGALKEPFGAVIHLLNNAGKPIIACDLPSGVDADHGALCPVFIKASHILFLSLPKQGCRSFRAKKFVADIGVPKALYPLINIRAENYFGKKTICRI